MPGIPRVFNYSSGRMTNAAPYRRGSYLYNLLRGSGPAGGGGGVGGGNLFNAYQKALNEANAANKKRQEQIESDFETSHGRVGGLREKLEGSLQSSRDMARGMADQEVSEARTLATQHAIKRGMGNTTVLPTMKAGFGARARDVENRYRLGLEAENRGIQSGLTDRSLGLDTQKRGFLERINDLGPDFSQMLSLSDRLGYARGGNFGVPTLGSFPLQGGMLGGRMPQRRPMGRLPLPGPMPVAPPRRVAGGMLGMPAGGGLAGLGKAAGAALTAPLGGVMNVGRAFGGLLGRLNNYGDKVSSRRLGVPLSAVQAFGMRPYGK